MADDDDDVAITEGQEAEVSIEDHRAGRGGSDDDGDEDEPALGIGPSGDVPRRGRVVSDKTRELFSKASKSIKEQMAAEEGESPFGEYDEGVTRAPKLSVPAPAGTPAAVAHPTPGDHPPAGAVPAEPPAPTLHPDVQERLREIAAVRAELDARASAIAEQERSGDMARIRDAYRENGGVVVRDLIKTWLGKDVTDDQVREEVADLITDLSVRVLGVEVPSEVKDKIEAKRALRYVKGFKDAVKESEDARAQRLQVEEQRAGRQRTIGLLDKEISLPDHVKAFPFLSAEDNPGQLVYEVCEAQAKKDGTVLQWKEAAKRADEYLRKQASAYYDKRKHLFAEAPKQGAPQNGKREVAPGDPQGIRRSHTLTNAASGAAPNPPPTATVVTGRGWTREAHRAETKARFRAAFTAEPEE